MICAENGINDPNIYCFNEQAKICQWDNEEKEFSIKSGTFLSVFKREIRALRNRKDKWQVKSN